MPTLTGWETKIRSYCDDHGLVKSKGQVQRIALKIDRRARAYWDEQEQVGAGEYRRITYRDDTGEDAVHNVLIEQALSA